MSVIPTLVRTVALAWMVLINSLVCVKVRMEENDAKVRRNNVPSK